MPLKFDGSPGRPAAKRRTEPSAIPTSASPPELSKFEPMIVVVRRDVRSVVASWLSIGFGGPNPDFYAVVRRFAESRWSVDLDSIDDPFGSMVALIDPLQRLSRQSVP